MLRNFTNRAVILAVLFILFRALYGGAQILFPIDFSQDYTKVQGVDNIIFEQGNCYKRCFWGLKQVKSAKVDNPQRLYESDASVFELPIDTDNTIRQSIYSPDKNYILYCEIDYDYKGMGITDDEYCYYRVYEVATGRIITIYQGYREWYNLFWVE